MSFRGKPRIVSLTSLVMTGLTVLAGLASATPANAATPVRAAIQWHQVAASVRPVTVQPMATCGGYGCDNKDPVTSGCADGSQYTVVTGNVELDGVTFATINLRYSPTCGTNWAQISSNRTGEYAVIRVCRDQGDLHCSDSFSSTATTAWSNQMYADEITATAYATLYLSDGQARGWATA